MRYIKKILMFALAITLIISNTSMTVHAQSTTFSTRFIKYNPEPLGEAGLYDRGTEPYGDNEQIEPGEVFQVDILLSNIQEPDINGIELALNYDADVLEPWYILNDVSNGLFIAPMDFREVEMLPKPSFGTNTYWSVLGNANSNASTPFYSMSLTSNNNSFVIQNASDDRLVSVFFRVKYDAVPGSEILVSFGSRNGSPSVYSVNSHSNNVYVSDHIGTLAKATVAGGAPTEPELNYNLSDISITGSNGLSYMTEFNHEVNAYDIVVPPSVSSITFGHTFEDPSSDGTVSHGKLVNGGSVSGFNLSTGNNTFKSVVKDGDGNVVKEYDYNIKRLSNSTGYILTGIDNNGSFVFETSNRMVVSSTSDSVDLLIQSSDNAEFGYALTSTDTTIDGLNVPLNPNKQETKFTLEYIPEYMLEKYDTVVGIEADRLDQPGSMSTEYTLEKRSGNNNIASVSVKDDKNNSTLHTWDISQDVYNLDVANAVSSISLDFSLEHDEATVMSVVDNLELDPGLNVIVIQVNAPDGTQKFYTFNINRTPRSIADLDSLSIKVDGIEKNVGLSPSTRLIELEYGTDYRASILAIAKVSEGATIKSGNVNNVALSLGSNKFNVVVLAEDGSTEKVYSIDIVVKENTDSNLEEDIEVDDESWVKDPIEDVSVDDERDPEDASVQIYRYTLGVGYEKKTFSMDDLSIVIPEGAQVVGGNSVNLSIGDNAFVFEVISQDGKSTSRYILTIHRHESDAVKVDSIQLSSTPQGSLSGSLEQGFVYKVASSVFDYTVSVNVSDDTEVISGEGSFSLSENPQVHTVVVRSQDGTVTESYEIRIEREISSDASLSKLYLSYSGYEANDILSLFVNNRATVNVAKDVNAINLEAILSHPNASYTVNNTSNLSFDLNYGNNTFNIVVLSEDGTPSSYVLTVVRAKSDDANLKSLSIDGNLIAGWSSDITEYTLENVSENVDALAIGYETRDVNASVSIVGNGLKHGENVVQLIVTAQDGVTKKTYSLNVYRELSSSVDLVDINPSNPNHDLQENEPYHYVVYVPYGTKTYGRDDFSLHLMEGASVIYAVDAIDLSQTRDFVFTVVSPNGKNTQEYIISVVVMDSMVPRLDSIAINGSTYDAFDSNTFNTTIVLDSLIPIDATEFEFTVVAPEGVNVTTFNKTITVTGKAVITQSVIITRLSDGLLSTYNFTFTRTLSDNTDLSGLDIEGGVMTPSFDENPDAPFYEVQVPKDMDTIVIDATPANPNSNVKGDGEVELFPGKNIVKVIVEAEDHSDDRTYELVIMRELGLNALSLGEVDVDLSKGTLVNNTLTFNISQVFDKDVVEAYLNVVANHSSVSIRGSANTVVVLDNKAIQFTLVAQDGETTLDVVLNYVRTLNSDPRLASINTLDEALVWNTEFDSNTFVYNIEVPYDFTELKRDMHLEYLPVHPNTKVVAPETMSLSNTSSNVYELTATAEDGSSQVYTLNITRGTYNYLEKLAISKGEGHLEQVFEKDVFTYTALVYLSAERFSFEWDVVSGVRVVNGNDLINIPTSDLPNTYEIVVAGDNGETQTYSVLVNKGISTRLISMESSHGVLDFNPDVNHYTVHVARDTSVVSLINVLPEDAAATVSGLYTDVQLVDDTTLVELTISNGGYEGKYTVSFIKTDDLTGIDRVTANDGRNFWESEFKEDGSFEIVVNHETDLSALDLGVDLKVPGALVEFVGPFEMEDGAHQYEIIVTDGYGIEKSYDVVIRNDKSDNNYLENLTVNGLKVAGFNRYATHYEVKLSVDDPFEMIATPEDENATVSISAYDANSLDQNVHITVTSDKGNTRVYVVNVTRDKKNIATLETLAVKEARLSPVFNKDQRSYYVTIPFELEALTIEYETMGDATALVESDFNVSGNVVSGLPIGTSIISVNVMAEDGSLNTYTIEVLRTNKSENYLDTLGVLDAESLEIMPFMTPFDKEKTVYTVVVPYNKSSFIIEGDADDSLNVYGLENIVITEFPYVHEVRVVDAQNIVRTYAITFVKAPSENPKLANLWTSEGALNPVFDPDILTYTLDVDYDVMELEILYSTITEDQVVTGAGTHSLSPGTNRFEVEVVSGDVSRVYTIVVNRAYGTAKLDWLEVTEGVLSPLFNSNTMMYTVVVENEVESLTLNAGSNNNDIDINGTGLKSLEVGNNVFEIVVTAGQSQSSIYYVVVYREQPAVEIPPVEPEEPVDPVEPEEPEEIDLSLAYLSLDQETLNEVFDESRFEYTADLSKAYYDNLGVIAIARSRDVEVSVTGNANLNTGTHTIYITVSEGERSQVTTIEVTIRQSLLESNIHEVGDKYIATVKHQQTVLDLKNQMLNPNALLYVYFEGELLLDDEIVPTGAILKLIENEVELDSRIIVILGDVNGDGYISIADLMKTQSFILGAEPTETEKIAADVSQDGSVAINDFMIIQSHILEIINIHDESEGV